jgi:PII-like signaling protein
VRLEGTGTLLRIFVGESDTWHGRPLYQAIVERARERGLAGATVLRGIEGFGADSRLHTARILRLSEDLPVLIEIVDTDERIRAFLPTVDEMVGEGLLTMERVQVIAYRSSDDRGPAGSEPSRPSEPPRPG